MKEFAIYKNPIGQFEAVKKGFSWPGFFFAAIWAFVKKMWAIGGATIGVVFVVFFVLAMAGVDEYSLNMFTNIVNLAVALFFGIMGNQLREKNLNDRGFELVDTVQAANSEGAIAIYVRDNEGSAT